MQLTINHMCYQYQSSPNTVGPPDMSDKICASPGEISLSPDQMSGIIYNFEMENVAVWKKIGNFTLNTLQTSLKNDKLYMEIV